VLDLSTDLLQNAATKRATKRATKNSSVAGKIRHLLRRPSGFYARVTVPAELRQIIGKRELTAALHANRATAVRLLPGVVAGMQAQIERARLGKQPPTPPPRHGQQLSTKQMAWVHYVDQLRFDDEARAADHRYAMGFVDEVYVEHLNRAISGAASTEELQETVGWIFKKFRANGNTDAAIGSPAWREQARALAVAEKEALARTTERDEGDFSGQPTHPLLIKQPEIVGPKTDVSRRRLCANSTKPLTELAPEIFKERRAGPQAEYEATVTIRMFDEHLGKARAVYQITRADIQGFKKALAEAPANYVKRFPGMTLPQAIEANKQRNEPYSALNPRTINDKYLSKLHSMLNWCVKNDLIPDNPATGIKVDVVRGNGKPPRVNFSPTDLTRIFDPKLFTTPYTEDQWAMLLSLFTGARASELAQVQLDQIRRERGILVMGVEEELKTTGSRRVIPIHSTLIALGFEKLVKSLRGHRKTHLFPKWYADGMHAKSEAKKKGKQMLNHYFPRFIPKRFNVTYLPKVGVKAPNKTWHSFRHTFKTGLSRAGVSRGLQDDLCGHEDYSAGGAYRHDVSIEAMHEAVEKLQFDGFELGVSPS
jgi:integrase